MKSNKAVKDIDVRRLFSLSNDVHIKFKFHEKEFVVWEPFGDNSRYWIGPEDKQSHVDIKGLVSVFEEYKPPVIFRIFGDLYTLKILSWFSKRNK